jgi:cyclin-dependent kinase
VRLLRRVGCGTFSEVYKAKTQEGVVAVKVFRDEVLRKVVDGERSVLSSLSHRNVTRLLGTCWLEGRPCLLLPLAGGVLNVGAPLGDAVARILLRQLRAALLHVHARGLVHLDVKPNNLLLFGPRHLKLSDFGNALREGGDIDGLYACTRTYRAPELLLGAYVARRTMDLWSFGCVAAEMALQSAPLYHGKNGVEQLRLVVAALGPPSAAEVSLLLEAPPMDLLDELWYHEEEAAEHWAGLERQAVLPSLLREASGLLTYDVGGRARAFASWGRHG